jgi:hypothetical protein
MTLELALRATEILLGLAFLQQSIEHIFGSGEARFSFLLRAGLSAALLLGVHSQWVLLALSLHSLFILHRYDGPADLILSLHVALVAERRSVRSRIRIFGRTGYPLLFHLWPSQNHQSGMAEWTCITGCISFLGLSSC